MLDLAKLSRWGWCIRSICKSIPSMRTLASVSAALVFAAIWLGLIAGVLTLLDSSGLDAGNIPDSVWRATAATVIGMAVWAACLGYAIVQARWPVVHGKAWTYCGHTKNCNCGLEKVCLKTACGCERTHACATPHCNCGRLRVCSKLECKCSLPKVYGL